MMFQERGVRIPKRKREIAVQLAQDRPVKQICEAFELAHSTFYYQPKQCQDLALGKAIERVIMDVFTRAIRGWHLGRGLDQTLTMTALKKALEKARPEIHHSDQGVQYAAAEDVDTLCTAGAQISMADVGDPTQNGHVERPIHTIKEEEVDLSEYENYHDAYSQIERFLEDVYMFKRIHSSLGYPTPAEFEREWMTHKAIAVYQQESLISCPT